jgi:hypothetical protein
VADVIHEHDLGVVQAVTSSAVTSGGIRSRGPRCRLARER